MTVIRFEENDQSLLIILYSHSPVWYFDIFFLIDSRFNPVSPKHKMKWFQLPPKNPRLFWLWLRKLKELLNGNWMKHLNRGSKRGTAVMRRRVLKGLSDHARPFECYSVRVSPSVSRPLVWPAPPSRPRRLSATPTSRRGTCFGARGRGRARSSGSSSTTTSRTAESFLCRSPSTCLKRCRVPASFSCFTVSLVSAKCWEWGIVFFLLYIFLSWCKVTLSFHNLEITEIFGTQQTLLFSVVIIITIVVVE